MTMLPVLLPLSLVLGPIYVRVGAFPMCLVLSPSAFVNIAIGMLKSALTFCLVVLPLTHIPRTIRPNLSALTITLLAYPLSGVLRPGLVHVLRPATSRLVCIHAILEVILLYHSNLLLGVLAMANTHFTSESDKLLKRQPSTRGA